MSERTKVLFLCLGNSCRSQMAEAIAKHRVGDVIEASSAGLVPFGEIVPPTVTVLSEHGVSAEGQYSKPLRTDHLSSVDLLINMTGSPGTSILTGPTPAVEDWDVGDPYGFNLAVYRKIRDEIESRIEDLARRLREKVHTKKMHGGG